MTVVNPKSISGINSITTGSGSDNLLTIHTSDASSTERVRINSDGDVIVGSGITVSPDGDIFATGVTTSTTFVGNLTGNVTGTLQTAAQTNITSVGSLSSLVVTGGITATGGNIVMNDSSGSSANRIKLGTSQDLQLFHDGSNSYLRETGTGSLFVEGNSNIFIGKASGGAENCVVAKPDAEVELYYNNSLKLETLNSGVEIFGTLITEDDGAGSGTSEIQLQPYGTDGYINCTASGNLYTRMGTGYDIRTRIDSSGNFYVNSGNLVIGTSGKGIDFSATTDAAAMGSELLDDYEEGDFTPNFDAGGGVTFSYNHRYGFYTKIGDTVTFQLYIMGHASSISSGNESNGVVIQGLPYTILNHSRYYPAFFIGRTYNVQINDNKRLYSYGDSNSTNIRLIQEENDTAGGVLTAVQLDRNPCLMQVGGVYRV